MTKTKIAEKYFTQQWVTPDVAARLKKSTILNPEYNVYFEEVEWHEDGDLVKIRLTFRNCGKTIYMQRVFSFLIKTFYVGTN
jgi:hypothetical protein